MKKVFSSIGLLLIIFSFSLHFMLTETGIYFVTHDDVHTIELTEEFMSLQDIEKIAIENNVMIVNREIIKTGIGKTHIKHRVFNPTKDVKEGIEKSIFGTGKKEIEFIKDYNGNNFRDLYVYTNNNEDYENVVKTIKGKGYDVMLDMMPDTDISVFSLFSVEFLEFYILQHALLFAWPL